MSMHTFTRIPLALAWAIGLTLTLPAVAQDRSAGHDHAGHAAQAASGTTAAAGAASADLPMVDAEVRRVDASNNKLALRHQQIPNLDMPPMTMVFDVADPALLKDLKAGDKVRVSVDEIDGKYTVMSLQR
jgi:Cu(I)/Ag(I) efflux system periplasmic protein CusF